MRTVQILRRFSFNEWGGTETVVWNLARQLRATGNPVEIAATAAFDRVGCREVEQIAVHRFKTFYPMLGLRAESRATLERKGGNPFALGLYNYLVGTPADLLHCHCMQRLANTTRRAAAAKDIPYVISFQGGHAELAEPELLEMTKPIQFWLNYGNVLDYWFHERSYLNQAHGIVCVDYQEYQDVRQRFPEKPVEYLPNGVDHVRFGTPSGVNFRAVFNIPPDRCLILCISRIDSTKNQHRLLELTRALLDRHQNPHLVLIGPISSELYYEKLIGDMAELNLSDRVTISRGLRFDDPLLEAAYQAADCFILPSVQEPFGIVVLEAWAAGTPVICSRVDGLRRLVTDGETGLFFDDFSSDDLLRKFQLLQEHPELRQRLIDGGRREVTAKYSWEKVARQLLNFYDTVRLRYREPLPED